MSMYVSTPRSVGDALRSWLEVDGTPVEALIDAAWEQLGEQISDRAMVRLMEQVDELGTTPIGRRLALATLRRALAAPGLVGANMDALTTYPCRCGPGRGMVEVDTGWRPCADCNPGGYAPWRDHWSAGCKGCPECRPDARRRGMQGDHRAERSEAEADERRRRTMDDLR